MEVDACGQCGGPGKDSDGCCTGLLQPLYDGPVDCAGDCGGTQAIDACNVCGGSGRSTWYLDVDNDNKADSLIVANACEQPENYIASYTELDTDDNCKDENYDGCGLCADIGDGSSESGYLSTMIEGNCIGAGWTPENCINDFEPAGLTPYNIADHEYDNAMDCGGVCLNDSNPGIYGEAYIDTSYIDSDHDGFGKISGASLTYCTGDGVPDGYANNGLDKNDAVSCLNNNVDCNGVCHPSDAIVTTQGYPNAQDECVFVVYPGDVNMNGKAELDDIDLIVNFWKQHVNRRNSFTDLDGEKLESEYAWKPQFIHFNNVSDSCKTRADANGDGRIDINDVMAVFINFSEDNHGYANVTDECSALVIGRELDSDIFYNIYTTLPPSELKASIARKFGFEVLPAKFIAYKNYPNPFNPITSIKFDVPIKGEVVINILNVKGQLIEKNNLLVGTGYHLYQWDASNYPSGVYFYRIFYDGEFQFNHKMIYLK